MNISIGAFVVVPRFAQQLPGSCSTSHRADSYAGRCILVAVDKQLRYTHARKHQDMHLPANLQWRGGFQQRAFRGACAERGHALERVQQECPKRCLMSWALDVAIGAVSSWCDCRCLPRGRFESRTFRHQGCKARSPQTTAARTETLRLCADCRERPVVGHGSLLSYHPLQDSWSMGSSGPAWRGRIALPPGRS